MKEGKRTTAMPPFANEEADAIRDLLLGQLARGNGSELPVPLLVPVAANGKTRAIDLDPLDVVHLD